MRTVSLALFGCLVAASFPCQALDEPSSDALLREVLAMNEKITALTQRVAELEKELKEVRQLAAMPEFEKHRLFVQQRQPGPTGPFGPFGPGGPPGPVGQGADRQTLDRITLPQDATRGQVAFYIRQILDASAHQTVTTNNDPQTQMLLQVGPQNLDLLLDAWKSVGARGGGRQHLSAAIELLLDTDAHKQMLLDRLAAQPDLIVFIEKKNWLPEARPIMIEAVEKDPTLAPQWTSQLVGFKDPRTYDALAEGLVISRTPSQHYSMIKDLPGIELDDAVHRAWKRLRDEHKFGHFDGQFAGNAMSHGNLDALGWLVDLLQADDFDQQVAGFGRLHHKPVRDTLLLHIDFEGSDDEIKAWYYKNKDRLEFDKKRKVFKKKFF